MNEFLSEFKKNLLMRIIVFAFMGMGWDVIVTTVQKIAGGMLDVNAVQTASTWMFIIYGLIPVMVFPLTYLFRNRFKLNLPLTTAILLIVFYITEYCWGTTFAMFGITPWSYNWYTPNQFNTSNGYISFHPAIVVTWIVFIILIQKLDDKLRTITR